MIRIIYWITWFELRRILLGLHWEDLQPHWTQFWSWKRWKKWKLNLPLMKSQSPQFNLLRNSPSLLDKPPSHKFTLSRAIRTSFFRRVFCRGSWINWSFCNIKKTIHLQFYTPIKFRGFLMDTSFQKTSQKFRD